MRMARRLNALEKAAGQGDAIAGPRVIFLVSPTHDDVKNNRSGRVGAAMVVGAIPPYVPRGDDESKRDFLARVAAISEPLHGPVSDDWYESDAR